MPDTGSVDYFAGTETLAYPGVFTGVPNNGDVTIPLNNSNADAEYKWELCSKN